MAGRCIALARTFPSEKALALQLATQAQRATHLDPAVGIAANEFTAAQAARRAMAESGRVCVVPPGSERRTLASLPLTALPDPPVELLRRLHLFGITRLGGFARLPPAAVVRQFDPELAVFHDLARGLDRRPLVPHAPPPTVTRTLTLPHPLADQRLLLAGLERLVGKIAHELAGSGYHVTALTLMLQVLDLPRSTYYHVAAQPEEQHLRAAIEDIVREFPTYGSRRVAKQLDCPISGVHYSQGWVLLLGHSDTVYPPGTAAERPMNIQGGKVLGPGACDMKAGLLTGIYALQALREIGFDDFESITYLCVSDEETERRHSIPLIRSQSRRAHAILVLEAARENGDIVTARKAIRWYTVEAFGRSAHAGVEPQKGSSAILALAHHIVALDALNGLRPGVTVNTGYVEGGSLPSIVADHARMRLDLRAFMEDDIRTLEDALHEQLSRTAVPGVRVAASLEQGSVCPSMKRTPAVVELERLAQQAARELGFEVQGASTGGASDANFAADEGGPVLDGLGPVGGLDHSPGEYIMLDSIVPRTALLAKLMIAIALREKER